MATAKAKLHTVMVRLGQKCRYETWQLPHLGTGSVGAGHQETALLEFSKEGPMFACKLHLPDGTTIQSNSFRRKKDAEQDAALHALQKVRFDDSTFLYSRSHGGGFSGIVLFFYFPVFKEY